MSLCFSITSASRRHRWFPGIIPLWQLKYFFCDGSTHWSKKIYWRYLFLLFPGLDINATWNWLVLIFSYICSQFIGCVFYCETILIITYDMFKRKRCCNSPFVRVYRISFVHHNPEYNVIKFWQVYKNKSNKISFKMVLIYMVES